MSHIYLVMDSLCAILNLHYLFFSLSSSFINFMLLFFFICLMHVFVFYLLFFYRSFLFVSVVVVVSCCMILHVFNWRCCNFTHVQKRQNDKHFFFALFEIAYNFPNGKLLTTLLLLLLVMLSPPLLTLSLLPSLLLFLMCVCLPILPIICSRQMDEILLLQSIYLYIIYVSVLKLIVFSSKFPCTSFS